MKTAFSEQVEIHKKVNCEQEEEVHDPRTDRLEPEN